MSEFCFDEDLGETIAGKSLEPQPLRCFNEEGEEGGQQPRLLKMCVHGICTQRRLKNKERKVSKKFGRIKIHNGEHITHHLAT